MDAADCRLVAGVAYWLFSEVLLLLVKSFFCSLLKRCAMYIIVMKNGIMFECNRQDRTFINIIYPSADFSAHEEIVSRSF